MSLTATPRAGAAAFELRPEERDGAIGARLVAPKPTRLPKPQKLEPGSSEHAAAFAEAATALRDELAEAGEGSPVVAVVVNRVKLAREVFGKLSKAIRAGEDAILLTGRCARSSVIADRPLRGPPNGAASTEAALFVVATQCIEAGADFDFDGLVTQIAPLDALRQRFGRLNRRGAKPHSRGVVLAAAAEIASRVDDPLYGDRASKTWAHLIAVATDGAVEMSPAALAARDAADPDGVKACASPSRPAPTLRRADLDFLAMTSPRPSPDPHLPLFLHGDPRIQADIGIVWRADLEGMPPNLWAVIVGLMPPEPPRRCAFRSGPRAPGSLARRRRSSGTPERTRTGRRDARRRGPPGAALAWRGRRRARPVGRASPRRHDRCPRELWRLRSLWLGPLERGASNRPGRRGRRTVPRAALGATRPRNLFLSGSPDVVADLLAAFRADPEMSARDAATVIGDRLPGVSGARGLTLEYPYGGNDGVLAGFILAAPRGARGRRGRRARRERDRRRR